MAYDPEARETSNNAMIIGVVALVLVVLGALAYYATNQNQPETATVIQPTTITKETVREVPSTTTPTTVVVDGSPSPAAPAPAPATSTRTDVTVNAPAASPAPRAAAPAPGTSNTTIVNNTPPAASNTPAAPPADAPAGDAASNSSTGTGTPAPGY